MSEVRAAAGRRYPVSEASGGREETPRVRDQGRPGEATSHLAPEARRSDPEEPPRARGQGRYLGGATHAQGQGRQREEQPEEWWLRRHRRA